ncbi:DDE_Tnp_1-associated family protein, partial [Mycobacterium ulcerans str. Harvey]
MVTVRRWSGVAVPTVSALPVSSVPEVFDRWSAGERSELIGSEFLDVLASVPDPRDPRGRRYSLMALLAIAVLATAAGMRGYAGFATWAAPLPMMCWPIRAPVPAPSEKTFRAVLSRLDPPTSTPGWAVTSLHTWPAATPVDWADRVGRQDAAWCFTRQSDSHASRVGVRPPC